MCNKSTKTETRWSHNPFTNTRIARFILWVFVAFSLLYFNGCGPSSAEIKQEFEKAEATDTRTAYFHFIRLWPYYEFWSTSCSEYSQYQEYCGIAKNRIREMFSLRSNRVELWPDLLTYKVREVNDMMMDDYIRNKIEKGFIARGYSVAWAPSVTTSEEIEDSWKPATYRRADGFDAVIKVNFWMSNALDYHNRYKEVPLEAHTFCTVYDTRDGANILSEGRTIERSTLRGPEPYGIGAFKYSFTESEDSFLARAVNALVESVPEYHLKETKSQ